MLLPTLLAALLVDQASSQQRARSQELSGRLGLGRATPKSGPAVRLAWAAKNFGFDRTDMAAITTLLRQAGIATSGRPQATDGLIPWYVRQRRLVADNRPEGERARHIIDDLRVLRSIRDWYLASRPNLGSLSFAGAAWAAEQYHEDLAESLKASAGQSVPPGEILYTFPDGYTAHALTDLNTIQLEGQSMQNCLAEGYYDGEIKAGTTEIFSLRGPPRPDGLSRPVVTIAFSQSHEEIGDAYEERERIYTWAEENEWVKDAIGDVRYPPDNLDEDALEEHPEWEDDPPTYREYYSQDSDNWIEDMDASELWDAIDELGLTGEFRSWLIVLSSTPDPEDMSFPELKGRQNQPPAPRYRAKVMEFLRWLVDSRDIPRDVILHDISEVLPLLSVDDPEFAEVWGSSSILPHLNSRIPNLARGGHLGPDELEAGFRLLQQNPGFTGINRINYVTKVLRRPDEATERALEAPLDNLLLATRDEPQIAEGHGAAGERLIGEIEAYSLIAPDFATRIEPKLNQLKDKLPPSEAGAKRVREALERFETWAQRTILEAGLLRPGQRQDPPPDDITSMWIDDSLYFLTESVLDENWMTEETLEGVARDMGIKTRIAQASISALLVCIDSSYQATIERTRTMACKYRYTALLFAQNVDVGTHPETMRGVVLGANIYDDKRYRIPRDDYYNRSYGTQYTSHREPSQYSLTVPGGSSDQMREAFVQLILDEHRQRTPDIPFYSYERNQWRMNVDMLVQWIVHRDKDWPHDTTRKAISANDGGLALWYAYHYDWAPHPLTRAAVCRPGQNPQFPLQYALVVDQMAHPDTLQACLSWPGAAARYAALTGPNEQLRQAAARRKTREENDHSRHRHWPTGSEWEYQKASGAEDHEAVADVFSPDPVGTIITALRRSSADPDTSDYRRWTDPELERLAAVLHPMVSAVQAALKWTGSWSFQPDMVSVIWKCSSRSLRHGQPSLLSRGRNLIIGNSSELRSDLSIGRSVSWTLIPTVRCPRWWLFDRLCMVRSVTTGSAFDVPEQFPLYGEDRVNSYLASSARSAMLLRYGEGADKPFTKAQAEDLYGWVSEGRRTAPDITEHRDSWDTWNRFYGREGKPILRDGAWKFQLAFGSGIPVEVVHTGSTTSPLIPIVRQFADRLRAGGIPEDDHNLWDVWYFFRQVEQDDEPQILRDYHARKLRENAENLTRMVEWEEITQAQADIIRPILLELADTLEAMLPAH